VFSGTENANARSAIEPLPAHETWPGARYRFCLIGACKDKVALKGKPGVRYVEHQQIKCGAIGCTNYVPEGRYATRPGVLICSAKCARALPRVSGARRQVVNCRCGCGAELTRRLNPNNKEGYFASSQCRDRYRIQQYLTDNCGVFKDVVEEYLEGAAAVRYRGIGTVRASIVSFFRYLGVRGNTCLESVTPKTITDYIIWSKRTRSRDVGDHISYLSVFFKWAMTMGYRESASPVIGAMHSAKQKKRVPCPYSDGEMDRTWHFLNTRVVPVCVSLLRSVKKQACASLRFVTFACPTSTSKVATAWCARRTSPTGGGRPSSQRRRSSSTRSG
jgi:integrase/recombinase XerC